MDHLESILPRHSRITNHIYISSADYVFPPTANESASNSVVINDNPQLTDVIKKIRIASKLKNPATGKKILQNVLRSTQLNLAFIKIDLTKWTNETPIDVRDFGSAQYVVLREDNISDENLCEFMNIYSSTSPMAQPQIIILPNAEGSRIEHRLRYANSSITFSWLNSDRLSPLSIARSAPKTIDEFIGLFDRRCFEVAARVDPNVLLNLSAGTPDLENIVVRLALVRARILTAERSEVEQDVNRLLLDMDSIADVAISKDTEPFLLMRSLALLQKAYCSEKPSYLNEALAIASTLKHDLGVAMCLRYAHFFDVHPALECHMLDRAEKIFEQNDCKDLAIYCANNRLVSLFSAPGEHPDKFEELINRIDEVAPAIHRRDDVIYNMAVEHLFSGRVAAAHDLFAAIVRNGARPLVVASAMLGLMACQRMGNARVTIESALELISFTRKNIAHSNQWHITNLFLNVLVLLREHKQDFELVYQAAKSEINLTPNLDVRDVFGENRLMATSVGLDNYHTPNPIKGRFGTFFAETGMTLPYYFIWS